MSILPKEIVLRPDYLVVLNTSDLTPPYISKYSPFNLLSVSPKSITIACLFSSFSLSYIFL